MNTLFAYGTLTIEEVMTNVTGKKFGHSYAVVKGFARYRLRHATYPGIARKEGSQVEGKLYYAVDEESLARLDAFEDEIYDRLYVQAVTPDRTIHNAFAYSVKENHVDLLTEEVWDAEQFVREHLHVFKERYKGLYCIDMPVGEK